MRFYYAISLHAARAEYASLLGAQPAPAGATRPGRAGSGLLVGWRLLRPETGRVMTEHHEDPWWGTVVDLVMELAKPFVLLVMLYALVRFVKWAWTS